MRLLALLQGMKPEDQIGYHDGFQRLITEGLLDIYHAMAYRIPRTTEDWKDFYEQAIQLVHNHNIDTILLQFFHGSNIASSAAFLQQLRKKNPASIVIATCGDPYGRIFHRVPHSMLEAAHLADLTFFTGMGHMAQAAVKAGAKNVMLMPHGCCQVRFGAALAPDVKEVPEFDLIFIGSNNGGRNPFTLLSRAGKQRYRMVQKLETRYGRKFALFGHNWGNSPSYQGIVPYNEQVSAIRRARLAIGGFPGANPPYYLSDRPFISMVSGVPFLDFRVPRVDRLFVTGRDWYLYDDIDSLIKLIDTMLDRDAATLTENAKSCRMTILARHTQYHRAKDMLEIAQRLRQHRQQGLKLAPQLPNCFHEDTILSEELPFAVLNWQG
jgi:hypothetical protein